jgi:hypothetical protein
MRRLLFFVLTSCCFLYCKAFGGDNLEREWEAVKRASLIQGNESRSLGQLFLYNKQVPKNLLSKVLGWSNRLRLSAEDENKLDSVNFNHLRISNDSLNSVMPAMFKWLALEQDSLLRDQYHEFQNRILMAAKNVDSIKARFNEVASHAGSPYHFGVQQHL